MAAINWEVAHIFHVTYFTGLKGVLSFYRDAASAKMIWASGTVAWYTREQVLDKIKSGDWKVEDVDWEVVSVGYSSLE
jgi:hypothetical protein